MSGFRLERRVAPDQRLDLSGLLPGRLAALSVAEVERLPLGPTDRAPRVGDVFAVHAAAAADRLVIEGGSDRFDGVGQGLDAGHVLLEGDAGYAAGRAMAGGRLELRGGVGTLAADGLRGGLLTIAGDAGPDLGRGMSGGVVVAARGVGVQAGLRMRRGLLVVEGDAAAGAGAAMIAGTLVVCGTAGDGVGTLMRRGTLVLGALAAELPATFIPALADVGSVFLKVLARSLAQISTPAARLAGAWAGQRFLGDMATLGRGEVFLAG